MKTLIIHLIIIFLLMVTIPTGAVTKVGTTAAVFLNVDVGARAVGMGGSYTTVVSDVSSMYWNPAGLTKITNTEALFCHNRWIADINFNFAAFAVNLGEAGIIGVHTTFVNMDQMEVTTIDYPDGTGEMFDAGSYAVGISYARNLTDRFSIGASFKYINEYIHNCSAQGVALDIGTLYDLPYKGLKIGMSIKNYGTKMQMDGRDLLVQTDINPLVSGNNENINSKLEADKFDLPLMFRVGISADLLDGVANSNLIISVDALHPNDDVEYINIGGEYLLDKKYAIRAGYKSLFASRSEEGLTLGAGISYPLIDDNYMLKIDYAYQDFGVFDNVQMFSIGLAF